MRLPITISLPDLWGSQEFQKTDWGYINFLVGPNGTGKTLFAEQLKQQCQRQNLKPRYLNAERLSGFERQNYNIFGGSQMEQGFNIGQFPAYKTQGMNFGLSSDAFVLLKEKLDVRIRIEATLSQLFGRRIYLIEEGGFLKPKMQKLKGGKQYGLKERECHGLKELITLLTFLYDDEYNCLIIDEPELHLHPQFQTLFLQEIRGIAGDPRTDARKKCFFLITHSPYYVDVRSVADLKNCVVFQPDKLPCCIGQLDAEDEWRIRRLLPRLNTHHKQFFFASRPIFVEGYFDQQLFSLIQEKREKLLGASGACLIDVGGKDELGVFFRLCKSLNIDAQMIADLDALFYGKLRQSVAQDDRCKSYLQSEGMGVDAMAVIGMMESTIDECLREVERAFVTSSVPTSLEPFRQAIGSINSLSDDRLKAAKRRCAFLVGLACSTSDLAGLIPRCAEKVVFVRGRLAKVQEAFRRCGVHILVGGELENYLASYAGNPYAVSDGDKLKVFEQERDFIVQEETTVAAVSLRYEPLTAILDEASQAVAVDMDSYLNFVLGDWIHKVQSAVVRGEALDKDSLEKALVVEWATHSRILDLLEFTRNANTFVCRVKLKPLLDEHEREVAFDQNTVAANYRLPAKPRATAIVSAPSSGTPASRAVSTVS